MNRDSNVLKALEIVAAERLSRTDPRDYHFAHGVWNACRNVDSSDKELYKSAIVEVCQASKVAEFGDAHLQAAIDMLTTRIAAASYFRVSNI